MYNLDAELPCRMVHDIVSSYCKRGHVEYTDLCK